MKVLLLMIILGGLFLTRNLLNLVEPNEFSYHYLITYILGTSVSLLFRIIIPVYFKRDNFKAVDILIFINSFVLFILLVGLCLLDSFDYRAYDYTAYIFASMMLGFIYRTGVKDLLVIHITGFVYFTAVYYIVLPEFFNVFSLLPLIAFSIFSFYFAYSRENMNLKIFCISTELEDSNSKLEESNQKLEELSARDALTELYNRRYLDSFINHQAAVYKRNKTPFSIIFVDVDHFKKVNDELGHAAGDKILKDFARLLESESRETDLVVRYGGEEFLIVLSNTDLKCACETAERIRVKVELSKFDFVPWKLTASFGVAEMCAGDSIESLIKRADSCLYRAKNDGRNLCVCSSV